METNKLEQIEKLNELKEKGILSQEEFEKSKKDILNGSSSSIPAMPQIVIQNSAAAALANSNGNNDKIKRYSKTTTLLYCLFLGWLGAHRFYTGDNVLGILYLCTCGLMGFGAFIDFILILFGGYKDCNGNVLV